MTTAKYRSTLLLVALSVGQVTAPGCATDAEGPSDPLDPDPGKGDGPMEIAEKCRMLRAGPFQPEALGHPFNGSEDFTFDGGRSMVGKLGNDIVRVNSAGTVTSTIASLPGQTLGLRFHPKGNLIGAMVGAGKLVSVAVNGHVTDLVTGLNGPNGVYVGLDANVWFTEGGANRVSRLAPDGHRTTIVAGSENAQGANGVVVNAATKRLFYTEYDKGKIHRVDLAAQNPSPVVVATIPGARLDGLVLDVCGNLYAVNQGSSRLFRVRIATNGAAVGAPELLASFPVNVANAQFGSGEGFDPNTLFVVGNPGSVFAVPVGISGAPVSAPAGPQLECPHTFSMPGTGMEQNVEVRGDFRANGWATGVPLVFDAVQHLWQASVPLPANTQIQYKFHYFLNGSDTWITDPNNSSTMSGNSVLSVTCTAPD